MTARPTSILDLPDEATFPAAGPAAPAGDSVLQAARDALLAAFDTPERRSLLDPFAPAAERHAAAIAALRAAVAAHRHRGGALAAVADDAATLLGLFAATLGWGPAQPYLDDPRVNEVKINGRTIMVQEAGGPFVVVPERFASAADVRSRAVQLAALLGVRLDAAHPQETLPVAHGTRVHVTIHPRVAEPDGALICIRRGRRAAWDLDDLVERRTLDGALVDLLRLLCRAGCSFLIAGRTGSGKTSLLEALANSWPGRPHIISIEDHALEIGIRAAETWTRELVDTQRDPQAFGRAAREALRQTPGLLLPGETRGPEAGAVLALALSDHAVVTTLHARSCAEALARFAGYAAQPGSYMYEGRRDDALRDACAAFDVVVHMDSVEALGRRLVAAVALVAGCAEERGALAPRLVPLAELRVGADGAPGWKYHARDEDGELRWVEGGDRTPAHLAERLVRARAQHAAQTRATRALVDQALDRAAQLIAAGEADRALGALRDAWRHRRDRRLLAPTQQALGMAPARLASLGGAASDVLARAGQLAAERRWPEALAACEALAGDVELLAALPAGTWERVEGRARAGMEREAAAAQACAEAEAALRQGRPRAALDLLNAADVEELSPDVALALLRWREAAAAALYEQGEGSAEALGVVRERRVAAERASVLHPGDAALPRSS